MGLQKYGSPEPIEPEADGSQKTAAKESWDEGSQEALRSENDRVEQDVDQALLNTARPD